MKRFLDLDSAERGSSPKQPRTVYAHAFKVLAPEPLSAAILGSRGAGVQEMQTVTDSKISIADRGEKYPNSNSRLVLIRANNSQAIDLALQHIVVKLKSLIDSPIAGKTEADYTDIITRNGFYRFKCVLPKDSAGGLIGKRGANIEELRQLTGCRVRIEEGTVGSGPTAEQVVSLVGTLESIVSCLLRINQKVQEAASAVWFQDWSHLKVRSTTGEPPLLTPKADSKLPPRAVSLLPPASDDEVVYRVMAQMPRQLVGSRVFAVQAALPIDAMSALIGKGGANTRDIAAQTGAKVTLREDEPNTTVTIEGSLNAVVSGYMLVMKKYLEIESACLQGQRP